MYFYSRLNTLSGPTFRQMYFFGFVSKLERESSIVISKGDIRARLAHYFAVCLRRRDNAETFTSKTIWCVAVPR